MDKIKSMSVASPSNLVNTWAETANAMAIASESWADWDVTTSDGITDLENQVSRKTC